MRQPSDHPLGPRSTVAEKQHGQRQTEILKTGRPPVPVPHQPHGHRTVKFFVYLVLLVVFKERHHPCASPSSPREVAGTCSPTLL